MAGRRKQTRFEDEPVAGDLDQGPVRRCVTTRARHARDDLIRFVLDPEGVVVPDLGRKLPGRGVWVSNTLQALEAAVKKRRFAAGFKRPVTVPPDLTDQCGKLMRARTVDALSLANKAGLVVAGFEKVSAALGSGDVVALVTASDGAADGADKLRRKHRAIGAALGRDGGSDTADDGADDGVDAAAAPCEINVLNVDELSLAIGRANVVHAALKSGGAADRFIREAGRLTRFGPDMDDDRRHEPR